MLRCTLGLRRVVERKGRSAAREPPMEAVRRWPGQPTSADRHDRWRAAGVPHDQGWALNIDRRFRGLTAVRTLRSGSLLMSLPRLFGDEGAIGQGARIGILTGTSGAPVAGGAGLLSVVFDTPVIAAVAGIVVVPGAFSASTQCTGRRRSIQSRRYGSTGRFGSGRRRPFGRLRVHRP